MPLCKIVKYFTTLSWQGLPKPPGTALMTRYAAHVFRRQWLLLTHDLAFPVLSESAVIGKADPLGGVIVKAIVTLADGYAGSDAMTQEI